MVETHHAALGDLSKSDAVVQRLLAAGESHAASALHWLDAKQSRHSLQHRAIWCILGSWLMVTAALAVGAFVAWNFAREAEEMFDGKMPVVSIVLPPTLIILTGISLLGGIIALLTQRFPGLASTSAAIDWSGTGDAVSRLLDAGCTYPEAFRAAAQVANTANNRSWLNQAAMKVEQGASAVDATRLSAGDDALVEVLLQADESNPSHSWRTVADHFIEIARNRLALLLSTAPVISTLLAGLIVWLSISSTLGAMWRYAIQTLDGFS